MLVVEHEVTNLGRDLCPLPVAFTKPAFLPLFPGDHSLDGPNCIGRCPEVVSCDVRHRRGLSRGEGGELSRIRQSTCRGIGGERCLPGIGHPHLAPDPGATSLDGLAWSAIAWLVLFEQVQDVLGAKHGPCREQPVVFIGQRSATADRDQSGVTLFREYRHGYIIAVSCRDDRLARKSSGAPGAASTAL